MSKGDETREKIVEHAFRLASRDGLSGLTVGTLATDLKLSKSGLFAHFGSKEELQLSVLRAAAERFEAIVVREAFRAPRGIPRLQKLFELWLQWVTDPAQPGGCLFVAAAAELDDKPGRTRDFLVASQKQLLTTITKAAQMSIDLGHFGKAVDCEQFAFDMFGIVLAYNHARRLMRDKRADAHARTAFNRLIVSSTPD
jgi:AcrR family transcriptional regulator